MYWVAGLIILLFILLIIFLFINLNHEVYPEQNQSEMKSLLMKGTDKNTVHSYIDVYEELFSPIKNQVKNVLEIGVKGGQSILLWKYYFKNSNVYGMDISPKPKILEEVEGVHFIHGNAYSEKMMDRVKNIKFDIMIDDGPHTLESMKYFVTNYSNFLADGGILVVEDLADIKWVDQLKNLLPENLKKYAYHRDLRKNKNRFDDIMFIVDTRKKD